MSIQDPPKVSIGLPVYNGENFLASTIDSILTQSYPNLELIIADNASTDQTETICRQLAAQDNRIRYYRHDKNLGAAKNYNFLVDVATGKYFKWIAHDDPLAPTCIERCVETLEANTEAIMCYPRTTLIDEHDEVIEYHVDGFDLQSPHPHERFRQSFTSSAWCHPVFGLIRSDILRQTGLIGAYASSDKVLLGELAILGRCYEVPEYLSYRRLHPQISTRVHTTDEAMAAWFDPAARKRVLAPRWRRLIELHKAIQRASLSLGDRGKCYLELGRFYISLERIAGAGRDLKQITRVIGRMFSNAR